MVVARRAATSRVGTGVTDGREIRAATDDQRLTGQTRAIVKKKKNLAVLESVEFCKYSTVNTVIDTNDCRHYVNIVCPYVLF